MGVFGLPEPATTDAEAALLAPIRVGIAVHYGPVLAGVLAYLGRLEFTVVGDAVYVAQRVEALTKEIDADLLVIEDVLQAATELSGSGWEFIRRQPLRGRDSSVGLLFTFSGLDA